MTSEDLRLRASLVTDGHGAFRGPLLARARRRCSVVSRHDVRVERERHRDACVAEALLHDSCIHPGSDHRRRCALPEACTPIGCNSSASAISRNSRVTVCGQAGLPSRVGEDEIVRRPKSKRYLCEARVLITHVDTTTVTASVRGSDDVYSVRGDQWGWQCDCHAAPTSARTSSACSS